MFIICFRKLALKSIDFYLDSALGHQHLPIFATLLDENMLECSISPYIRVSRGGRNHQKLWARDIWSLTITGNQTCVIAGFPSIMEQL